MRDEACVGEDREQFVRAVVEAAKPLGIFVSAEAAERMYDHFQLVRECNEVCGLTSVVATRDGAVKHYVDSLTVVNVMGDLGVGLGVGRFVDVGSGAGYPGLVVAIQLGIGSLALIEANEKKAGFLARCVRELRMRGLVVPERAEEVGRGPWRETFDAALSRAVGGLPSVLEVTAPLVRRGGVVIAMRGRKGVEEAGEAKRAALELGLEMEKVLRLELPGGYGERVVLAFQKARSTPEKYPRRSGVPFKRPLT